MPKFERNRLHKFDPGGRGHWAKPRCKFCQEFKDHPIHHVSHAFEPYDPTKGSIIICKRCGGFEDYTIHAENLKAYKDELEDPSLKIEKKD